MLSEIKKQASDRQLINDWLDRINEHDPACRAEVLDQCKNDKEARAYYVSRARETQAGEQDA